MSIQRKTVRLANGLTTHYAEHGDPEGIPVLLIHGYSDSAFSYEPILARLPSGLRAIAVSLRGHGDTDRPPTGYGLRDFSNDLALFADALGLDSVVVVGHSMGSAVAQYFVIEHPERVRALVLIGSFASLRGNATVEEMRGPVASLVDPVDADFVRAFQESTIASSVPADFLESVIAEGLKLPARVWKDAFEGMLAYDIEERLATIKVPVLAVWGEKETIFIRRDWAALAAAMPDARIELYAGAGHAVHWELPDRFAGDLAGFIEHDVNDTAGLAALAGAGAPEPVNDAPEPST